VVLSKDKIITSEGGVLDPRSLNMISRPMFSSRPNPKGIKPPVNPTAAMSKPVIIALRNRGNIQPSKKQRKNDYN